MKILSNDDIKSMSKADRMDLMGQLWDSFEDSDVPLTAEQTAELDRRLDRFDEDVTRAIPMAQVFAKLHARRG